MSKFRFSNFVYLLLIFSFTSCKRNGADSNTQTQEMKKEEVTPDESTTSATQATETSISEDNTTGEPEKSATQANETSPGEGTTGESSTNGTLESEPSTPETGKSETSRSGASANETSTGVATTDEPSPVVTKPPTVKVNNCFSENGSLTAQQLAGFQQKDSCESKLVQGQFRFGCSPMSAPNSSASVCYIVNCEGDIAYLTDYYTTEGFDPGLFCEVQDHTGGTIFNWKDLKGIFDGRGIILDPIIQPTPEFRELIRTKLPTLDKNFEGLKLPPRQITSPRED